MAKIVMGVTTIADKAVTTAGTRVRLSATSLEVKNITIQWDPSNTGVIYVGDANVAAGQGLVLSSTNTAITLSVDEAEGDEDNVFIDLTDIWIDSATNGDQVKLAYVTVTSKVY